MAAKKKAVSASKSTSNKKEKVVLAYSGGLDTTAIIPWLKETYDYEVIAVCVNVGQESELKDLEKRAASSGASKLYELDVIDEFADEYIAPCIQAHAVYEDKYLLGTSMARPLIAKKLVEIARKEGAVAICHGATGKGNDQVRFELGIKALAPDIKIIAAWRDPKWTIDSREAEIAYCESKGIHLPFSPDNSYSRDRNLWHISHEGLELENPANEPNYDHMLVLSVTPEKAPDKETKVKLDFEDGIPVALNGHKMKLSDIIRKLNKIGGENGIGIIDIVENRVVGMKSRGVYETPGGTIIYEAHQQLEELILDRKTYEVKKRLASDFSSLVYEGKWFSPLCEAERAFFAKTEEYVTGTVNLVLYKGNIIKAGTTAPYSMYNESLASFTTGDLYDHKDAAGFITLFGLPEKVRAMKMLEVENKAKMKSSRKTK
ncbi:MAG: argininosuccinate synthase [Lachnospiraceae bacterium]|nr:argininosuccinate synthase [Lachnospiraceae bacterium]MDD4526206.1 argininosuccinate synthase [Lachnospiraceae bacterium]